MDRVGKWGPADEKLAVRAKQVAEFCGSLGPIEKTSYSFLRAIAHHGGLHVDGGLENEISQGLAHAIGRSPQQNGFFAPTRISASLDSKTNTAGRFMVGTAVGDLIELLRNRARVVQLGATLLTGLSGDLSFPVQTGGSSGGWVQENPGSDVSDSDATFGARNMHPKTYQATSAFSRQQLIQSSVEMEVFVRNDLATAHALAIDAAAINGSGLSSEPLGLLKTTGIGGVSVGADGGVPTYENIVDLESSLANANADTDAMRILTTPGIRGKLRKTQQFVGTNGVPVWQSTGSVGVGDVVGYPGYVSRVPCGRHDADGQPWSQALEKELQYFLQRAAGGSG